MAVAAAVLSTGLQLRAEYRGPRWQVFLFKPLGTIVLLLLAALATTAHGSRYQTAVVVGLICSLAGDVFLMLPGDRFTAGLASFLLAHLAYIVAFSSEAGIDSGPVILVVLVAVTAPLLRLLWPGLGRLQTPVLFYTAAILVMVWRAWARAWLLPSRGAAMAAAGAGLFMVSDSLLAINRFRRPLRGVQALVMTTYMGAQALIALSVAAG